MCIKSNDPYLRLSMLFSIPSVCLLGLAFSGFLLPAISLSFLGFDDCTLFDHPLLCVVVVLGILNIAIDTRCCHASRCEARGMLRLVVEGRASGRHHADILGDVLLACEVSHEVGIGDWVFFFVLLALFDEGELWFSQSGDLTKDINDRSVLSLDIKALKLFLHLGNNTLRPASYLIIDYLHVFLAIKYTLQRGLQLSPLALYVGILSLSRFHLVLSTSKDVHLSLERFGSRLIVVCRLLNNDSSILISDSKLAHPLLLRFINLFQLFILSLIRGNSLKERWISLFLGHELLHDLTYVRIVGLESDLLEACFEVTILGHLLAHAFLEEGWPKAIDKQALPLLNLVWVSRQISSSLSNLSLSLRTCQPFLQSILLVLNRGLQRGDSFLSLLLLMIDHLH